MADYLEYDVTFDEIQEQDMPDKGGIYIYRTLGGAICNWIVSRCEDDKLGLFWEIENARIFAEAL